MPTSSDPFDIDDDLFASPDALDSLEAHALQSTQTPAPAPNPGPSQPRKRTTQPYHHQIARPSQTFSRRKEPAPLNTEPRAGNSGFGWEFGGKRSIDGNVERHIAAIGERAAYWSHGKERREEEEYPDVVVGKNGKYEFGQDMEDEGEEVVDNHARMGMGLGTSQSQVRDPRGAAARREAIAAASASAGQTTTIFVRPPLSRSNSASSSPNITRQAAAGPSNPPPPPQPPQKFAQRSLSRSVSAGSHPVSRPPSRINPLPPIASQSSQSSQGSATRRVAIELEEERRKREATEAQLKALQNQLLVEKNRIQESRKERETESLGDDPENWMKELQAELYKAKGEAETMRRAQKDVSFGR